MRVGGIILAGGRGRRMGVAKATLAFGNETLIERITRIVGEAVSPVIVVAAAGQLLPTLASDVIVTHDRHPDCGPLEGLAAGLKCAAGVDAVYVSGCDTPLLKASFIRRMVELLDDAHDAAVPIVGDLPQPLAGVYRASVVPEIEKMLALGERKMLDLLGRIRTRMVPADMLESVDPGLQSLRNLNTPSDYEAALREQGLPPKTVPGDAD